MNKVLLLLFLILFSQIKSEAQSWSLVWSDEFDSSAINTSNWVFETGAGGWGNNELEYYTNRPVNANIYNGNLIIVARKESFSGSNYTSARMKTQNLQSWMYGKIEARIKLPMGKGLWPAFWMLGENISTIGWPKCGEIDIMEHVNTETTTEGTMHWDNNGHAQYGGNISCDVTQYHTYAIQWNDSAIKWYLDGNKYWEGNILNNINSTEEFHKPLFILLNFAVGGNWPGSPDATTPFPDTMFVDYVRVYQEMPTNVKDKQSGKSAFDVFPNPSQDQITITMNDIENGEYQVEVLDLVGKAHFRKRFLAINKEDIRIPIDINNLPSGIYLISIRGNQQSFFKKLIKY